MTFLIELLIQIAVSVVVFVVCAGIVGAMQRRGWDPVSAIARFLSPDPAVLATETGEDAVTEEV